MSPSVDLCADTFPAFDGTMYRQAIGPAPSLRRPSSAAAKQRVRRPSPRPEPPLPFAPESIAGRDFTDHRQPSGHQQQSSSVDERGESRRTIAVSGGSTKKENSSAAANCFGAVRRPLAPSPALSDRNTAAAHRHR
nr:uncharacterized protein LOC109173074 [Ipomoea trifida]